MFIRPKQVPRTLDRLPQRLFCLALTLFICGYWPRASRSQSPEFPTQVEGIWCNPHSGHGSAIPAALPEIPISDGLPMPKGTGRVRMADGLPFPRFPMNSEVQISEVDPKFTFTEPSRQATSNTRPVVPTPISQLPLPLTPWWEDSVALPVRADASLISIDLDQLFVLTATHSGRVQAIAQTPWISQTQVEQSRAAFDPTAYGNARYDSTSDPVENTLTTGGASRLQDHIVGMEAGVRGRNYAGTTYSLGQRLGHKNSNSDFFVPNDQGTSRLFANLTHPLLRGRRIDPARSLVITARFQTKAAQAEYQEAIQKQLFQVADAYWLLYTERASLLQRRRHLVRAQQIADLLHHRENHDSSQIQIRRARSAVANRKAEIIEADTRIRNLESRIRALTNAPELSSDRMSEFLPVQAAQLLPITFDMQDEVGKALQRRPELKRLANQLSIARTRLRLAQDQTKPTLNLVAEGYVAGLQGDSDIFGAWTDQFSTGRPGYAAGLVYERPVRNREAKAAVQQWRYEIDRLHYLTVEATGNIQTEVETALRNVEAAKLAAESRWESQAAAAEEVETRNDRWISLGNDRRLGQLQLDDLLRSQDRLLQEEQNLLQALVRYHLALLEVQRATGMLVQFAN